MNSLIKASVAFATLVAFSSAPIAASAQPVPAPVPESSGSLKDAAKEGLPIAAPGIAIGVVGGILLAKALAAAAVAGTAVTVGTVALPIVLIAAGVGLLAWGSWKAYKAISARNVVTRPTTPPTNVPGRNTDGPGGTGTNPNPPGNNPGGPSNGPRINNLPPGVTDVDIRVHGIGSPSTSGSGGTNAGRNDATRPSGPGELPSRDGGAGTPR